jgi:phosphoglycerate kinase
VQQSIVDENSHDLLMGLNVHDSKLIVPTDYVLGEQKILDIGAESIASFSKIIADAKTIIWNGPMGLFEDERYANGTKAIAESILANSALSIIGGGDTISAVDHYELLDKFSFVSTGGGAMLAFLSGDQLPALKALHYYE